jgi:hypothetical protein
MDAEKNSQPTIAKPGIDEIKVAAVKNKVDNVGSNNSNVQCIIS